MKTDRLAEDAVSLAKKIRERYSLPDGAHERFELLKVASRLLSANMVQSSVAAAIKAVQDNRKKGA